MVTARKGEVSVHVDAPPARVWALLASLDRMGEWSPECQRVEWLDGAASPAVEGSRFKGFNKVGRMRWSVLCEVTSAKPPTELAVTTILGGRPGVRWTYRLAESGGGTDLTESFEVIHLPFGPRIMEDYFMRDRDRRREDGMRVTLERIKGVAETGSSV